MSDFWKGKYKKVSEGSIHSTDLLSSSFEVLEDDGTIRPPTINEVVELLKHILYHAWNHPRLADDGWDKELSVMESGRMRLKR